MLMRKACRQELWVARYIDREIVPGDGFAPSDAFTRVEVTDPSPLAAVTKALRNAVIRRSMWELRKRIRTPDNGF